MSQHIGIQLENIRKSFKLPVAKSRSIRSLLINRLKGKKGYVEQEVLKDISFKINAGDFFGIVGKNGSGKSTLLKIITQIYTPDSGTVTVNGELVSIIELGVGFNNELTGRENVYLRCALFGFTKKEIDEMYDDIVDFAELHQFMDQKLELYSSGMRMRLSFAVAIKAKGDILILDEVLAVGDAAFKQKCKDYFLERKKNKQTTVLVTHDMGSVIEYCNRAILIDKGYIISDGTLEEVTEKYYEINLKNNKTK